MNNPNPNNMRAQDINIDFSQTTAEVCEKCGCKLFTQRFLVRKLSALLSPTGQEAKIPMPLFACANCNHVNESFLPKEDFGDDDAV
tara:strand:+ start:230 stop:487 length:258 start_codon:yes stop_codon:yes gene_type:complete